MPKKSKRPLPFKKLMTYRSFCEYAKDNYLQKLFKPGDHYNKRYILKSNERSITHIGMVEVCGSISPRPLNCKSFVYRLLSSEFAQLYFASFRINEEDIWTFGVEPWYWIKHYSSYCRKKLPLHIERYNVQLSVSKIDLNSETVSVGEIPDVCIEKKLFRTKNPCNWVTHLGARFYKSDDKYQGARIGLYTIPLSVKKSNIFNERNWWDAPKLMYEKNRVTPHVKVVHAVYLPFVSLAMPSGIKKTTVLSFDIDDFLPNPGKRRSLFDILHRMNKSELDAFFAKYKVAKHSLGASNSSEDCLKTAKSMSLWEKRWLRVKAITAHQPNSVLGQILVEANEALVKFTLQYFAITAKIVNQLQIGCYNAVEQIARVGRLPLLSSLLCGKLKLQGKVLFSMGASFKRSWSVVFAAIEVDNVEYLKMALKSDDKGNLLTLRDDRGVTALGLAVMMNKVELVHVLLKARAEVDQPSWGEETALCLALQFGASRVIVDELIKAEAKTTGVDLTGTSIREQLEYIVK